MNRDHFTQSLQEQQFNEVLEKSMGAGEHNAAHSHPFDVRALVTQGDITLTSERHPRQRPASASGCRKPIRISVSAKPMEGGRPVICAAQIGA